MWSVLARTLLDELDSICIGPEDNPERLLEDNDQVLSSGCADLPMMKKIFTLWKRNQREYNRLSRKVRKFKARRGRISMEEYKDGRRMCDEAVAAGRKQLLWQGMWWHVVSLRFPHLATHNVEFCRGWRLVLVGEPER